MFIKYKRESESEWSSGTYSCDITRRELNRSGNHAIIHETTKSGERQSNSKGEQLISTKTKANRSEAAGDGEGVAQPKP